MSPKSKSAKKKNKYTPHDSSETTDQQPMDVNPATQQAPTVHLIKQPDCVCEVKNIPFQSNMLDKGARVLRKLADDSEVQDNDFILIDVKLPCQVKSQCKELESDIKRLKEILDYKDKMLKEEKDTSNLDTKPRPSLNYGKVSEYLRYFGDTVVLPAMKKDRKPATTQILPNLSNWNELLQYLGPFRGRTPEKEQLQKEIYEVVLKHGISEDQWTKLYEMNRERNNDCHGLVDPKIVREMIDDVKKMDKIEFTAAAHALADAIERLPPTQSPYSTSRSSIVKTPTDSVPMYRWSPQS